MSGTALTLLVTGVGLSMVGCVITTFMVASEATKMRVLAESMATALMSTVSHTTGGAATVVSAVDEVPALTLGAGRGAVAVAVRRMTVFCGTLDDECPELVSKVVAQVTTNDDGSKVIELIPTNAFLEGEAPGMYRVVPVMPMSEAL